MSEHYFEGVCIGGPYNNQRSAQRRRMWKVYRPMIALSMNMENTPVEAVELGEYHLNHAGEWLWWANSVDRG
jgi:hypothetical protein